MPRTSRVNAHITGDLDDRVLDSLDVTYDLLKPLTSTQVTAVDLYDRGMNVFPIPRPEEVRAWAAMMPQKRDPNSKPPYLNRPFFTSRMHKCNQDCMDRQAKTVRPCLPDNATFRSLFERANIAVMLGRTSGNLMAIDCDSHLAFKNMQDELNRRNIPYWAYTSHRGGGYLMRLHEGEVKNMPKDGNLASQFGDVEIFGNRHYVVLPPSLHPAGTFYQWVKGCPGEPLYHLPPGEPPPLVHLSQLEWLEVSLSKKHRAHWEIPELVDGKPWTAQLSRNNRQILNSILVEGTRNTNLTKPTYDIAALISGGKVGYPEGLQLLLEAAGKCGYPEQSIRQMLRSAIHKAGLTPAAEYYANPGRPQLHQWQKALSFAVSWKWTGRTAQTDRAVFLACIERARLDDRDVFRCSEREIAELAACERATARRALQRLRGEVPHTDTPVLLVYVCSDAQTRASMYRFADFPSTPSICTPLTPLVVCGGVVLEGLKPDTPAEKDLFWRQKVAWRIWRHLCQQSESSKGAIVRATGLCWSSVSRGLEWLMQLGMVVHNAPDGYYFGEHFTDEALSEIARSLNQAGRSEKRRLSHILEREKRLNMMLAKAREDWSNRRPDLSAARGNSS